MSEIRNAIIKAVFLGREDHGIPPAYVTVDYGSSQQGFGGYGLKGENMSIFVLGVLDALHVESWEKLVGKSCRVETDGLARRIGHFLEDRWFDPRAALK